MGLRRAPILLVSTNSSEVRGRKFGEFGDTELEFRLTALLSIAPTLFRSECRRRGDLVDSPG